MEIEEVNAITESSTIRKNLISRIQEVGYSSISGDSEETIVNMALMNLLLDFKYIMSSEGIIEPDYLEDVDSSEELHVLCKIVKGASLEGLITVLAENVIDYHECITKY